VNTDDLIGSLVADSSRPPASPKRAFGLLLPLGVIAAFCLFVLVLDMRPDFRSALGSWRYLFKIAVAASIALFGLALLFRLARPEQSAKHLARWILFALAPLGLGMAIEAVSVPMSQWPESAMGYRALYCLLLVPLISLPPLAAGLFTLRQGAPQSPMGAGAVAGFAAGGLGALIYALHCNNDSPFYVAIWYLAAIGIVTLLGAAIGRSLLRW
jgi:hypothetical protein